jgi:hypothetical protein
LKILQRIGITSIIRAMIAIRYNDGEQIT